MVLKTTSAIVLNGDYDEESRKNPVLKFFEDQHNFYDSREHEGYEEFYTEEWRYRSTHGEHSDHEGTSYGENHTFHEAAAKFHMDPLDDHKHFNEQVILLDGGDGKYEIVWMGHIYAHVKGTPAEGERTIKDPKGQEWDVEIPATYHFDVVKESGSPRGYKISGMKVFKDTHMINDLLEQRDHGHLNTTKR